MTFLKGLAAGTAAMLLASGCTTLDGPLHALPAGTPEVVYKATGTNPRWDAWLTQKEMSFAPTGTLSGFRMPITKSQRTEYGVDYEGKSADHAMKLSVIYGTCGDLVNKSLRFAHSVIVDVDGQQYHGCGGQMVSPFALDSTTWRILHIDQKPLSDALSRKTQLSFTRDRINVTVGCNRIGGGYRTDLVTLLAGPLMSTRMGCPAEEAAAETYLNQLFDAPVFIRQRTDGIMMLVNPRGESILLVREN